MEVIRKATKLINKIETRGLTDLEISTSAKNTIKEIIENQNDFEEIPFLCLGKKNSIEQILYIPQLNRGAVVKKRKLLKLIDISLPDELPSVDKSEIKLLFALALKHNLISNVIAFGHLHPANIVINKRPIYLFDSLLEPSNNDIKSHILLKNIDKLKSLEYMAIAAVTSSGPSVIFWSLENAENLNPLKYLLLAPRKVFRL